MDKSVTFKKHAAGILIVVLFLTAGVMHAQSSEGWIEKASLPGGTRFAAFAFSIGDKGYVGGGYNFTSGAFSDFWEYDPSTDVWTEKADFGAGGRSGAVAFSINGKGYVMTGMDEFSVKQNDTWEYDPISDTWLQKADLPATGRNYAVAFSLGSRGYLGTGYADLSFTSVRDFWQYDPVADTWTKKADVPGPARSSAIGFGMDGKGYIGTGDTCNDFECFALNDFYAYDTLTDTWSAMADAGDFLRDGATAFAIGHKGYICTGTTLYAPTNDLIAYDAADNTWSVKVSVPGPARTTGVGFSIGNKAYVGTGFDPEFNTTNDWYEYTADTLMVLDTTATDTTVIDTTINDTTISAINFFADQATVSVMPNPMQDISYFTIISGEKTGDIFMELYSVQGIRVNDDHFVKQIQGSNKVIFVFSKYDLPPGIYLYRVRSKQNALWEGKILIY